MVDRFVKATLVVIAVLLGVLTFRPVVRPAPVLAQDGNAYPFYVEPGYTMLRQPDGKAQVLGKVVIDMRSGDIWGFPTLADGPYPVDPTSPKPPKSHPMYLGKFVFSEATRPGQ